MKQIIFFTGLLMLGLCSCGDDELLSESILDTTWEAQSFSRIACDNESQNVEFNEVSNSCIDVGEEELVCNWTYRFLADGSVEENFNLDGFGTFIHTVDVDNNNDQLTICSEEDANTFFECLIYKVVDDQMTAVLSDSNGCMVEMVFIKA